MDDTDLTALYAAVVAHPQEDTPRLEYADRLDELGGSDNEARSEFIRLQIERYHIGPKRRTEGPDNVTRSGPDYWTASVTKSDYYGAEFKIGERVDVAEVRGPKINTVYGLFVTRIIPDDPDLGTFKLVLKHDEYSLPYPTQRVKELDEMISFRFGCFMSLFFGAGAAGRTARGLWVAPVPELLLYQAQIAPDNWLPQVEWRSDLHAHHYSPPHPGGYFTRGFIDSVYMWWDYWAELGDRLTAALPITDVTIRGELPEFAERESVEEDSSQWKVAGKWVTAQWGVVTGIDCEILHKRWPSVARWHLPEE